MASFLDKAGLTKFWENVKKYINSDEYINNRIIVNFDNRLTEQLEVTASHIYNNIKYIPISTDGITFNYNEGTKGYSASISEPYPYIKVLLKYYNRILLLRNINDRNTPVNLSNLLYQEVDQENSEKYLGRLPGHEIYEELADKIYSRISYDIYLRKEYTIESVMSVYKYYLILIPVPISNCYTLNFIPGEQMIRYLGNSNNYMSSYNFCKVNLVTDSPFDFTNNMNPIVESRMDSTTIFHLNNDSDIEYTIRYPRYLNGLLTFLKLSLNNKMELADKTPEVVDGTYNEVVLTKGTSLYMYGDINISRFDFPIDEEIKLDISSTQDTTNKLLTLEGHISTIYGLLSTYNVSSDREMDQLIETGNFKLFHSPYIGEIHIDKIGNLNIPFDPLNKNLVLYKGLYNNTGISMAVAGIHIIGNHPYVTTNKGLKGIFNNYAEAYKDCSNLTKLYLYVYLEGDLNLDSTLEDYHIQNAINSIGEMVDGSSNLKDIILLPTVEGGLNSDDFLKFSKLIQPIVDILKQSNPRITVEIHNSTL